VQTIRYCFFVDALRQYEEISQYCLFRAVWKL